MTVRFFRNCLIDRETATLYKQYCDEHDFGYEASEDGSLVYFSVFETKENLESLNKWILKMLYCQEAQRGENNN